MVTQDEFRHNQRYASLCKIRRFETLLLDLFSQGLVGGTTHTCLGQEADAVALSEHLREDDWLLAGHRCHGHYLARFDDPRGLLAEIAGHDDGICGGLGGSQHLRRGRFLTNGIQGGLVPVAAGLALSERLSGSNSIAAVVIGDGTMGQGVVYEAINMASLWSLPLLVVVEDNGWAQSTPRQRAVAGSILDRARAFGIEGEEITSTDAEALSEAVGRSVARVRSERRPHWLVIGTYRAGPHSKGDDNRTEEEIHARRLPDPLDVAASKLDPEEASRIKLEAFGEIDRIADEVVGRRP